MSYHIRFDGAVSAEFANILRTMETRLNWHGVHGQAQAPSDPASGVTPGDIHPGHPVPASAPSGTQPPLSVEHQQTVTVLAVGMAVALFIGFLFGKRHAAQAGPAAGAADTTGVPTGGYRGDAWPDMSFSRPSASAIAPPPGE